VVTIADIPRDGNVSVSVAGNVFTDYANNGNQPSNTVWFVIDRVAPSTAVWLPDGLCSRRHWARPQCGTICTLRSHHMCAVAAAFSPFVDVAAGQVLCCNGEPFVSNSTTVSGTVFVSETLALAPTLHFITVTNADVVGWEQLTLAEAQRAAGTQACTACGLVSRLVPV
jgi:hypothetical protein